MPLLMHAAYPHKGSNCVMLFFQQININLFLKEIAIND